MSKKKLTPEQQQLRQSFLDLFVQHLISNTKVPEATQSKPAPKYSTIRPTPTNQQIPIQTMIASPKTKMMATMLPIPQERIAPVNYPLVKPAPGMIDLGKLNILVNDPRVSSIECSGAQKPVVVKIGSQSQNTSMSLSKEEIESVIKSFSERTKIPIVQGVFKAAHGNLLITATNSEFIGSKFLLEKRTPFSSLR